MTIIDAGALARTALEEYLPLIDAMLAQPFPDEDVSDATGWAGPGHRVLALRTSRDFRDDDADRARDEAEAEMTTCQSALAAAFTARWGEPLAVDLFPHLVAGCEGEEVPEPINQLSGQAVDLQAWPLDDGVRWFGLTVGQGDKELPFELLAAVGEMPALAPAPASEWD